MSARRRKWLRALVLWGAWVAWLLPGGCTYSVYRAGDDRFLDAPLAWRPGETTALEVARALGPPDRVRQRGSELSFIYRFQRRAETRLALSFYLKLFSRDQKHEEDGTLLLAFDDRDRLLYYGTSTEPSDDLVDDLGLR